MGQGASVFARAAASSGLAAGKRPTLAFARTERPLKAEPLADFAKDRP